MLTGKNNTSATTDSKYTVETLLSDIHDIITPYFAKKDDKNEQKTKTFFTPANLEQQALHYIHSQLFDSKQPNHSQLAIDISLLAILPHKEQALFIFYINNNLQNITSLPTMLVEALTCTLPNSNPQSITDTKIEALINSDNLRGLGKQGNKLLSIKESLERHRADSEYYLTIPKPWCQVKAVGESKRYNTICSRFIAIQANPEAINKYILPGLKQAAESLFSQPSINKEITFFLKKNQMHFESLTYLIPTMIENDYQKAQAASIFLNEHRLLPPELITMVIHYTNINNLNPVSFSPLLAPDGMHINYYRSTAHLIYIKFSSTITLDTVLYVKDYLKPLSESLPPQVSYDNNSSPNLYLSTSVNTLLFFNQINTLLENKPEILSKYEEISQSRNALNQLGTLNQYLLNKCYGKRDPSPPINQEIEPPSFSHLEIVTYSFDSKSSTPKELFDTIEDLVNDIRNNGFKNKKALCDLITKIKQKSEQLPQLNDANVAKELERLRSSAMHSLEEIESRIIGKPISSSTVVITSPYTAH